MPEGMNTGSSPEELKKMQEQQDNVYLTDYLTMHPELAILPENLREAGPEIAEFEAMITSFESSHSLEALNLIIDLTPKEAPNHLTREPARLALIPIVAKLNALKKETNIPEDKYEELKAKYKKLSRAVGMINKDKVDHTR